MRITYLNRKEKVLLWLTVFLFLSVVQAQAAIQGISGTTVFNFEAKPDHVITGEGNSVLIWGLDDLDDLDVTGTRAQYPAPTLIVNQNDIVTINLTNNLPVTTSLVFPGHVATATGGSAAGLLTNEAAANGGTVSYQFTATEPGTYMYHSGTNPALQVDMGLIGAIIVRPTGFDAANDALRTAYGHADSAYDYEVLFLHTEMDPRYHDLIEHGRMDEVDTTDFHPVYWFFNGRNAPDTLLPPNVAWMPTQPYNCLPRVTPGDKILVRMIGGGRDAHPLHLHGNHFDVIARDGRLLSSGPGNGADLTVVDFTQSVYPGETYDTLWQWTGAKQGWDIYGTTDGHTCDSPGADDLVNNETGAPGADGYHDITWEWCADHGKPIPVDLPNISEVTLSPFYSGSPYLGASGDLPPGEGGFNANGGFFYPWHSHAEQELTNNDIFPGGQLTFIIIEPPTTVIE